MIHGTLFLMTTKGESCGNIFPVLFTMAQGIGIPNETIDIDMLYRLDVGARVCKTATS
jgi:hypothetical protein